MPNILRNLRINRVASVDKGAGEGVQIVLMKRNSGERDTQMTPEEKELAKKLTFEHKKDGTTRMWHEPDQQNAEGNEDANDNGIPNPANTNRTNRTSKSASSVLHRAIKVLKQSVESIFGDAQDEQTELLTKTMSEFETHVQSAVAASDNGKTATEDASGTGEGGGINKKESTMTEQEVKALQKALEDTKLEVAVLKLSPAEQEFVKAMSPEDKGKFCAKDDKARNAEVEAKAKSLVETVPESVKKALADAEVIKGANEALAKRVAELEAKDETAVLAKRATEIGLGASDVETIRKARKGDVEAVKALEAKIGALTKQVKESGLFKEFGNGSTVGGSAYDQIQAKAAELRKGDAKLTQAQAFEKAYTDPSNQELVQSYKREKAASI